MRLIVPSSLGIANTVVNIVQRPDTTTQTQEHAFGRPFSEQPASVQRDLILEPVGESVTSAK
jgi:hypothetical protein